LEVFCAVCQSASNLRGANHSVSASALYTEQ